MSLLRLPFIRSHFSLLLLCISVLIIGTHCDCGFPPRFTEAELRPEYNNNKNYTENSTVGYNCRPGYIRIPGSNNNITCLGNSSWSTPDEFCSKRSCPSLSEIENGYFQVKDFLFGSIATYFCNEGYRMESNRPFRECKADGTWSNADPVCAVVICAKPDSIPNGTYTPEKDEYNYQDAVTYSCNKDLVLTGRSTISCGSNGTWSTEVPKCIVVSCSNPNVLNSERLSGFVGPYTLNSGVSFKCKDGFVMNGSSSSVCNIDSQWEPPLPECLAITCPEPEVPNSERVTGVSGPYIVNSQVSFKCKSNFTMKGSNSSTCGITGQWAPPLPECLIVSCPEPEVPNSERVTGISGPYIVNSQVSFKCKSGFTIKGSNSSTCGNDGHWEPRLPECLTITCPEPEVPNSERVTGVSGPYIVNSQVSFKCKINFTIKGSNSSTCGNDGQWAPPLPECLTITCPEPEVPNSERVTDVSGPYIVNSQVSFKCKSGFTIKGSNSSTCSIAGHWEPPLPECLTITCPEPEVPNSERVTGVSGPYIVNSQVSFKCKSGFTIKGSNSSTCSIAGHWEPPLPENSSGTTRPLVTGILFALFIIAITVFA